MEERVGRMKVYKGVGSIPDTSAPVVTVGSFDGVHLGHKALLRATVSEARRRGVESVVVTFWPHPRKVLKSGEKTWLLTPADEKLLLLEKEGIDNTVVIPFDEAFSRMGSQEFVGTFIRGSLNASAMVVGYDHRFGHNKDGNYNLLQQAGLDTVRIEEETGSGLKISSTEVRRAIAGGDMYLASQILGHNYFAVGQVSEGRFTPADKDKLMPPPGKYGVLIRWGDNEAAGKLTVEEGIFSVGSYSAIPLSGSMELEFL